MRDTDCMGRTPQEDDFVAYNLSGQIGTGFVTKKTTSAYYIECVLPNWHAGKQSIVRGGAQCMLVLDQADKPK